jgi:hypothetical protein
MEFEYLVVTIDRPWLQQDILDRSDWCWKQNVASNLLLSDGGNVTGSPPIAPVRAMPVLPTNMFIVRNVKLTGAWTQEDKDFYRDKVCASLGGGWGPFCAHGNYSQDTTESTYTGSFQNASLVI